ncbi:type III-B CRISPR module RAMP protein Cmr1 [Staphylospora marina]|uniref:type III-B CRISPR module RAMP protein Cmr1 n=1 Tax=Staphylospora marina TaxID=2490858 RepID=UPI000F5C191D|nr:type III-B CRISPR module RAMP protein Cmr1 [Staphylospora marina]
MDKLTATFRIVTPMFLAGADQEDPEIRLPSVKGALRFWYRAIDPEFRKREEALFGGTGAGAGQARFLMHLTGDVPARHAPSAEWKRSLRYVLALVKDTRNALLPGQTFTVRFVMKPNGFDRDVRRGWQCLLASVWLLGHLGGLGFRNRRGFGSVALEKWNFSGDGDAASLMNQLPLGVEAETPEEWMEILLKGLEVLGNWFPGSFDGRHTHLGPKCRFLAGSGQDEWLPAMQDGIKLLEEFRTTYRRARWALGLAMQVPQYKVKYQPEGRNRMASPAMFRIVALKERVFPLFVLMDAPSPKVRRFVKNGNRWEPDGDLQEIPGSWKQKFSDHLRSAGYSEHLREGDA